MALQLPAKILRVPLDERLDAPSADVYAVERRALSIS
jgi:hypothetical protein